MDAGNDIIGGELFTTFQSDACGTAVITKDIRYLMVCHHVSAITSYCAGKCRGYPVAAPFHPIGALVIEVADESMRGKRGLVALCGIEWQIAYEDLGEHRIGDNGLYDIVDGPGERLLVDRIVSIALPQ